ncbi:AIR synthase family protein [Candidatus Bathyarchaeota archaeon]|nr:AIR synthase family protein [Candidatus Bathyarchaeota archaeon]MBS7627390.1 AIR synthase family protein [Candidatus Bathyarchaeota archaeon]
MTSEPPFLHGKLPPDALSWAVYPYLGAKDARIIAGPSIGEDAAIIDLLDDRVLVVHSDPITGAIEDLGSLAVYVSTNDVATRGARPLWISLIIFLAEESSLEEVRRIMMQVDRAAKELGVAIVGGHTEVTPGLKRTIVACTAFGIAKKGAFVTTGGARAGNLLILTKGVAIEGTAILATDLADVLSERVDPTVLESAKRFRREISVVRDAEVAMKKGGVTAMHDPTEGGLAGGLYEMAYASNLGVEAYESEIIVRPETRIICDALGADPLQTIGSGALLIAVEAERANMVLEGLRNAGIEASVIGRFLQDKSIRRILRSNGTVLNLSMPPQDHLWKLLQRYRKP